MTTLAHESINPAVAVRRHPAIERGLRLGWFAKGVVYVLAGVLALATWRSARGGAPADGEASPTGALDEVANASGGRLLLVVLACGLFTYAVWRILSALLPGGKDADALAHRIGYVVSAVMYVVLGLTAVKLARESATTAQTNGNRDVTSFTADIMEHTAGRWLVGLVGVIVAAVGLYRASKGVRRDVNDELDLSAMSATRRRVTIFLAAFGEIGRGAALGLIALFLIRAAVTYDANEATGLDGVLRRTLAHPWGELVVIVVGAGFIAYGVFCLSTFDRRRLEAP